MFHPMKALIFFLLVNLYYTVKCTKGMSLCAIWTKDLNLEIGRNLRKKFAEGEGIWSTSKKRNKFQINAALTISNTREIQGC